MVNFPRCIFISAKYTDEGIGIKLERGVGKCFKNLINLGFDNLTAHCRHDFSTTIGVSFSNFDFRKNYLLMWLLVRLPHLKPQN